MRLFLTICCLSVAMAKSQGYNYAPGSSGGSGSSILNAPSNLRTVSAFGGLGSGSIGKGSIGFGSLGSSGGVGSGAGTGFGELSSNSGGSGSSSGGSVGFGSLSGGGYTAGGSGGSSIGDANFGGFGGGFTSNTVGFGGSGGSAGDSESFAKPIVHKQFISVSAPEDHENLERSKHLVIGRPQKNYRIVFIKAPSSSSANVKLSAEYAPHEEKTVIYVLSKKDSTLEVNDIATPAPIVPSKPEIFFIKYKTEEEAQHAQRQIQAEYDKIEGTSEHTDAGIAPQQSVVGILGDSGSSGSGSASGSASLINSSTSGSFTSSGSGLSGGKGLGGLGGLGGIGNIIATGAQGSTYLPPGQR